MLHDQRPKWFYIISSCLVFTSALYLYCTSNLTDDKLSTFHPLVAQLDDTVHSFIKADYFVYNNKCKISELPLTNKKMNKYFQQEVFKSCNKWNNGYPRLIGSNRTFLFIIKSSLKYYQKLNATKNKIKCFYRPFTWTYYDQSKFGTIKAKYGKMHSLTNPVEITNFEFIRAECFMRKRKIYTDFFSFVPMKHDLTTGNKINQDHNKKNNDDEDEQFSVLTVGLDSISRMNFIRQMPRTYEYLRTLDVIDMKGYNKIGDNTFPNLVAMLTGMSEEELIKSCWFYPESTFDNCPFIWKNFSQFNYKTLFAEDSFMMSTFNYMKSGFKKSPTHYYYNIFSKESESNIGHTKPLNAYLCIGSQLIFKTILEYTLKFTTTMKNQLYFAFVWTVSLSHDYLNLPRIGDTILENFIKKLIKNNTILILTSDHGIRWGEFRETYQGHIEERLPFLFFILPNKFKHKYSLAYRNLLYNQYKLITPYDVYETTIHLLNMNAIKNGNKIHTGNSSVKGTSLFNRIFDRDCNQASIPIHYCTCHDQLKETSKNDSIVQELAHFLIEHINGNILKDFNQICSKLKLHEIIRAQYEQTVSSIIDKLKWIQRDYVVTIVSYPGFAIFESTIRYNLDLNMKSIIGDVSRINIYSNQSYCIDNYKLKLYCFCKKN